MLLDAMAIAFVFIQMHFIFCNWKLSITGAQNIARFGTMHLVATNLWTWIRYILLEESAMDEEIRQVFARDNKIRHQLDHIVEHAGHGMGTSMGAMEATT